MVASTLTKMSIIFFLFFLLAMSYLLFTYVRGLVTPPSRVFGARELTSVSSVHSWIGDTGVALVQRTPATFYVRLALPPHLCTFEKVMGWESDSECRLGYVLGYLSRLISARSARW